jgi:hypothetical protein
MKTTKMEEQKAAKREIPDIALPSHEVSCDPCGEESIQRIGCGEI